MPMLRETLWRGASAYMYKPCFSDTFTSHFFCAQHSRQDADEREMLKVELQVGTLLKPLP